ncbi:hypothetical protein SUGI_0482860 [Cryptomeria japonica]|nr:hypothetical protein SUGI_0482860 [Cryptomeria japonica]
MHEREGSLYSQLTKVELKKVFSTKKVLKIKEMSLSANQEKSKMKRLSWKVMGDDTTKARSVRGGPVDINDMVVELGPMEIRTFILEF